MGYFIIAILGITLLFIFPGIVSFISFVLGFLFNVSILPLDLLSSFIYPVGIIVYCVVYIFYAYLIYEFMHHHFMNK